MVETKDIDVIVQGAIYQEYTALCLKSLRSLLPGAKLILSTWENQRVTNLDYDQLVLSKDPGGTYQNLHNNAKNNINRQIISTKAGLKKCTRKYILKFRTDLLLEDDQFLSENTKYTQQIDMFRVFNEKIIICNYYTRNPRIIDLPMHFSDWVMFGRSEDIKKLWETRIMESELQWFKSHPKQTYLFHSYLPKYYPEQWIYLHLLNELHINYDCYFDNSKSLIIQQDKFMITNFIIKDINHFAFRFVKYHPNRYWDKFTLISEKEYSVIYNHYFTKTKKISWLLYVIKCQMKKILAFFLYYVVSNIIEKIGIKEIIRKIITR